MRVLPVGATADWTTSNDLVGIQGLVEVISERELVVRDFVSLVEEAPGVDIRLGVGNDFSDEVAMRLSPDDTLSASCLLCHSSI